MTVIPKNLTRYQRGGHLHFVTFSCHGRRPLVAHPATEEIFEQSPEKVRLRYDFFVTAYVVMPEHVPPSPHPNPFFDETYNSLYNKVQ